MKHLVSRLDQNSTVGYKSQQRNQLFSIIPAEKMPVNNNKNENNQGKMAKDFFITTRTRVILGKTFHLNADVRCYTKNPHDTQAHFQTLVGIFFNFFERTSKLIIVS